MNNKTLIIYYTFVLIVLALTGYAVFILKASGWWFLFTLLIMDASPYSKDGNKK
jgi:hypothetical protein